MSAELLFILGLAASAIVWLLKKIFIEKGKEVPVWVYSIALGVVAFALAVLFVPVVLPPFPAHDGSLIGIVAAVLTFIGATLPVLAAVVGFARIVYEALLQRVLDGLSKQIKKLLAPEGSDIG
jgi:hypothetical protein